jgi:DNA-directed RNA polymerase subunit RPC12/RpoP
MPPPPSPYHCVRCKKGMDWVSTIHPFGTHPGLVAYLCAACGHSESQLVAPSFWA